MAYFSDSNTDLSFTRHALPPLTLPSLASHSKAPLENLKGRPFILNFWGSWCVTCRTENPFLSALAFEGVTLVGVALKDTQESASQWLDEFGSPYTAVYLDTDGTYGEILGVQGAPETFVIDGEGNIRFHYQGLMQEPVWQNRVEPLWNSLKLRHE